MIPLFKVAMSPLALDGVSAVFESGQLEHGPKVDEFEAAVARQLGNRRVLAVNCGTSGLHLAVRLAALGAGAGPWTASPEGEVLSVPLTFEATNWSILANGLPVRWVDVDPATLGIDLADLERKITPATRAVMVVHWLGYPVDLDGLAAVLDRAEARHGLRPTVIEDAAQAWGATYHDRPLGNHGNIVIYSLGAIKLLTSGSGGLMVLPGDELYERARRLRWLGIDRGADRARGDYDVPEWGYRFPMNDIAAAIGLKNLEVVDELLKRTRDNAAFYDEHLAGVAGLATIAPVAGAEPSYWAYPLQVDDRAAFTARLGAAGIATSIISRRNDAHGCVAPARGRLPGLDSVYDRVVYVPSGWWLTQDERSHMVDTIQAGW